MVSTKYNKYYRTTAEQDKNGKMKTVVVYTGPYYIYDIPKAKAKKLLILLSALGVIGTGIFVGSLLFYSEITRIFYVSVPYACNFLSLAMILMGILNLWNGKEKLTIEQYDKSIPRIRGFSIGGMIFIIASLIGSTVAFLISEDVHFAGTNIIFLVCEVLLFINMLCMLKVCFLFCTKEEANPIAKEWEKH